MSVLQAMLRYIQNPEHDFLTHTADTLKLCIIPILFAMLIAIPVGILVAQRPVPAFIATSLSGIARAIPVLALLFLLLQFTHIGFTPAAITLTILGIPPILLNTIEGLRAIDPAAVDAARGMGMTPLQILLRIQIPLVLPVLAAGIRTAAVQIVATSPLAALIAAGGYGDYILEGISNLADSTELLVGATSVALLALLTEVGLALVQRLVTPVGVRGETSKSATPFVEAGAIDEPLAA